MNSQEFDLREVMNATINEETPADDIVKEADAFENKVLDMAKSHNEAEENSRRIIRRYTEDVTGEIVPINLPAHAQEEIAEIIVPKIEDTEGRLSMKIGDAMAKYNVRVIPVEVAGVLTQVTSLKDHELLEIDGVKYATVREPNKQILRSYRDNIYYSIASGIPYRKNIRVMLKDINDNEFPSLELIEVEYTWLIASFRNYNPRLIVTEEHEVILAVG